MAYCSKKCQASHWAEHKEFCINGDKNITKKRREKCLQIITSYSNSIFRYLFNQNYIHQKCFLVVYNKSNTRPYFVALREREILKKADFELSEKTYAILSSVAKKTIRYRKKKLYCKGIPVLYLDGQVPSVFLVGSQKMLELAEKVRNMPFGLAHRIMDTYVEGEISSFTLPELLKLDEMVQRGFLKSKPPP